MVKVISSWKRYLDSYSGNIISEDRILDLQLYDFLFIRIYYFNYRVWNRALGVQLIMKDQYQLMLKGQSLSSSLPLTNDYREFEDDDVSEVVGRVTDMFRAWADREGLVISNIEKGKEHSLDKKYFEFENDEVLAEITWGAPYFMNIYIKCAEGYEKEVEELEYYLANLENKVEGLTLEKNP